VHIEECVVAIPWFDRLVANYTRTYGVEGDVVSLAEETAPVLVRLLVHMILSALPRNGGGEEYYLTVSDEGIDI
jgi:hypothetical protein